MRVLWTHNFDPRKLNAGCFMQEAAAGLRELGVDLELQYLGNLRSMSGIIHAARAARRHAAGFDLVHAQYGSACALATSLVRGRPLVVTIRGNDWNLHSETLTFRYFHTRLARVFTQVSLPWYDGIVAVSRRLEKDICRRKYRATTTVIPSAINLKNWVPCPGENSREEKELNVLFVTDRLHDPVKRFDLARKSVDLARTMLPDLRFHTASTVPHEEMPRVVARMDAILCTSETEGWPNCIKEALACNVPFVATDVSDLAEIAAVEASCRVVAPDPREIADALCEVLRQRRPVALRRFVERMDVRSTSRELVGLYEEVLADYKRRVQV